MYLKAAVETGGAEVPALPEEAIIDFQGKKYIFIVTTDEGHTSEKKDHTPKGSGNRQDSDETQFTMYEVQVGASELGFTEVMFPETFDFQSKVAVKGAYALLSKMKNSEEEEGHH